MLTIVTIPNEILTKAAEPVTFDSSAAIEDNQLLAAAMIETATENDLYGLAAPQVNLSLRIFVVDMNAGKGEKKFRAFFNPEIKPIKTGNEKVDRVSSIEACASIPNVSCVVVRWNKIKVTAQDATGAEIVLEASGGLARIFQHEYDHLRGTLITSKAREIKRHK